MSKVRSALISEKSYLMAGSHKFTFKFPKGVKKDEIRKEIEKIFSVKVLSVNTANIIGKTKRTKKSVGKRNDYKKAIVTLSNKETINLFEIEKTAEKGKEKESKTTDKKHDISDNKDIKSEKKGLTRLLNRTTSK